VLHPWQGCPAPEDGSVNGSGKPCGHRLKLRLRLYGERLIPQSPEAFQGESALEKGGLQRACNPFFYSELPCMAIRHVIPRQMVARGQEWGHASGHASGRRVARIPGRTDRTHSTAKAKSGMVKGIFDLSQQNRDGA
jgi:hypothetical protein